MNKAFDPETMGLKKPGDKRGKKSGGNPYGGE